MRTNKILAGLLFVFAAVVIICDATGLIPSFSNTFGEVSFWRISAAVLLLCLTVYQLLSKSVYFVISLSFVFMVLEPNIAHMLKLERSNIINNWLLFGCSVLLAIGLALIFTKNPVVDDKRKVHVNRFTEYKKYTDAGSFKEEYVKNRWGATEIQFENTAAYAGNGTLNIENYMGTVSVIVPQEWNVICDIHGFASSVEQNGKGNQNGPLLSIKGKNTIGSVEITYK